MADRISHDQNFKNLILDYPRDALSFFAAPEAPSPEDSVQITPIRQELLQERFGAHYRELDVPLKVEWQDGLHETILFILEEETDWHRFSLHRLGSYCFELAELCKSDCVVPVVIFLREADSVPASLTLGPKHRPYVTLQKGVRSIFHKKGSGPFSTHPPHIHLPFKDTHLPILPPVPQPSSKQKRGPPKKGPQKM